MPSSSSSGSSSSGSGTTQPVNIKLTRTMISDEPALGTPAHYMEILAEPVESDPDADVFVFVHQVEAIEPTAILESDRFGSFFLCVTSPLDFQELPKIAPDADEYTLYRTDTVKAFFHSRAELDYAWAAIQSDVNALLLVFRSVAEDLEDGDGEVETVTL